MQNAVSFKNRLISTFLLAMIFIFSSTVLASPSEWVDDKYNFRTAKKIYVHYQMAEEYQTGWNNREAYQIFNEKLLAKLKESLAPKGYTISGTPSADYNLQAENETEANGDFDLIVKVDIQKYLMGTSYVEPYTSYVPVTKTTTINGPRGPMVIKTTEDEPVYHAGGDFPTAYVIVEIDVYDTKTNKPVWNRVDDRSKMTKVSPYTEPKDMFSRMMILFNRDLQKKLTS